MNFAKLYGSRINPDIMQKLILPVFLALIVSLSLLLVNATLAKIIISISCIVAIFVFIYPKAYFILFLILRPSIDLVSKQKIIGDINAASIATVFLILIGSIILLRKVNMARIGENKFLVNANKIFLCFLITSLASLVNTENLLISFADWLRLVSIIIVFNYAFLYFSGEKNFKVLFFVILFSAFLPMCLGLYQYLFEMGNQETPGFNRIYGSFLHPNVFAQYLAILFFAVLYFIKMCRTKPVIKIGLYTLLGPICFGLYHTYTRGVWIALAISLILFSISYKRAKKIIFFLSLGIILLAIFPNIQARFMDIKYPKPYQMSSWEWRILVWNKTKTEITNHPVIGNGLGMYEETFSFMAHNDYLRLAYEIGLLGLSLYLFFIFYILMKSTKLALIAKDEVVKSRYTMIMCITVALWIMSMANNLARSTVVLIYIFCIIGALLGMEVKNYMPTRQKD